MKKFLSRLLLASVFVASTTGVSFLPKKVQAQSSSRPFVVFVNGSGDCCAENMTDVKKRVEEELGAEVWTTSYANFRNGSSTTQALGLSVNLDTAFIAEGAVYINTKLNKNTPLVLIGHSYGGDSVLKLLPLIKRQVQFVAVIDPVSTGGFRSNLSRYTVPSNVDYFFNRWQKNEPFPNDYWNDGRIRCDAKRCDDQHEQPFYTNTDGTTVTQACKWFEACSRKNDRTGHTGLPTDDWIEKTIGDKISKVLAASQHPIATRFEPGFYSNIGMNPPGIIYLWPSPWDGGKTDVWCNVPNHDMYTRHINNVGSAIEVPDLSTVQNSAKYWSQVCSDDVFQHPRVQK